MQLEWDRAEEARKIAAEQAARQEEQRRIRMREQQLRQQEVCVNFPIRSWLLGIFIKCKAFFSLTLQKYAEIRFKIAAK